MKEFNEQLNFKELLKKMKIVELNFVRGLGIVDDRFELSFIGDNGEINIEIETNFRARNCSEVLLSFNDLYLDCSRKEMSVKKYRSQANIEKSFLQKQIRGILIICMELEVTSLVQGRLLLSGFKGEMNYGKKI